MRMGKGKLLTVGGLTALVFLYYFAAGQSQPQTAPDRPAGAYADRGKPTNAWQRTPREPAARPTDPVARAVRDARDAWCDHAVGELNPLDGPPGPYRRGIAIDRYAMPELPELQGFAMVVGTFADYDTIFSATRRSICTEVHITIDRVLRSSGPPISPGGRVTVLERGGAVRLSNRTIEHFTRPREEVLVPGHRYLLYLRHESATDSYTTGKVWELIDGRVVPFMAEDVILARQGSSKYAGMTEEEFLAAALAATEETRIEGKQK